MKLGARSVLRGKVVRVVRGETHRAREARRRWRDGHQHRVHHLKHGNGNVVHRCEGIAFAGGAAFSSEEGYVAATGPSVRPGEPRDWPGPPRLRGSRVCLPGPGLPADLGILERSRESALSE
jgi:hypothetical protein